MNRRDDDKIIIVNDNISDDTMNAKNTTNTRNTNNTNNTRNTKNTNNTKNTTNTKSTGENNTSNASNSQRIVAIIGVALLVTVICALLLTAIFDPTGVWFRACLVLAIALPILLWIYVWLYGMLKQKKTIASFEFLEENSDEKQDSN